MSDARFLIEGSSLHSSQPGQHAPCGPCCPSGPPCWRVVSLRATAARSLLGTPPRAPPPPFAVPPLPPAPTPPHPPPCSGRVLIASGAVDGAKIAVAIAVRYACQRPQFGERLIIDYVTHQVGGWGGEVVVGGRARG